LFNFRPDPKKGTSLRQNTRFEPSTIKIGFSVWALREHDEVYVRKQKNKKGHQRYISRVREGGTPVGGMMKLCTLLIPRTK
jgi:hypothetical protein